MPNNFSDQIIAFLEKDLEEVPECNNAEKESRIKAIKYFKESEGQCQGLAVLQAYGRRIDDDNESDKIRENVDDIYFFKQTKDLLLNWNREDVLDEKSKKDVERLISNIMLYQRFDIEIGDRDNFLFPEHLTPDPDKILQDTVRGEIIKSFGYQKEGKSEKQPSIIATDEMLVPRLEKIVNPQNIIILHLKLSDDMGHAVAIYQSKDGKIYLFNNENEIQASDLDDLAKKLFDITNPSNFREPLKSNLPSDLYLRNIEDIQIYRFSNDPQYEQPTDLKISQKEFKDFAKNLPNLAGFCCRDAMFNSLLNSLDNDDAYDLYQDPTIENESLKAALLFKTMNVTKKHKQPILSLPQMTLTEEMLLDRLKKLDTKNIGCITVAYEVDGPTHLVAPITRYEYNDKPLIVYPCPDGHSTMEEAVQTLWNISSPGNYRTGFPKTPKEEIFLRKIKIYVFDEHKNKNAKADIPSQESFKVTEQELSKAKESIGFLDPNGKLTASFLKQFSSDQAVGKWTKKVAEEKSKKPQGFSLIS